MDSRYSVSAERKFAGVMLRCLLKAVKTLKELEMMKKGGAQSAESKSSRMTISVGMATCGIAAGARPVMTSFANELRTKGIRNVDLNMMGCIGMCRLEPIVEVVDEEGKKTTYIEMTPEKAARVVREHIVDGQVVEEYTV